MAMATAVVSEWIRLRLVVAGMAGDLIRDDGFSGSATWAWKEARRGRLMWY